MERNEEKMYEVTAYTENSVGLLYSIAGIFARRNINIEKLLVYPSKTPGVHKFKIYARTTETIIRQTVLQIEKRVEVLKAYYEVDPERSAREIEEVKALLAVRDGLHPGKENK